MNVYPEDIETELNRIPGVKDTCVLGLEQDVQTVIHAVLLLENSEMNAKAIVDSANANLGDHQKVMSYSVWDKPDFPRTPTLNVITSYSIHYTKLYDICLQQISRSDMIG